MNNFANLAPPIIVPFLVHSTAHLYPNYCRGNLSSLLLSRDFTPAKIENLKTLFFMALVYKTKILGNNKSQIIFLLLKPMQKVHKTAHSEFI